MNEQYLNTKNGKLCYEAGGHGMPLLILAGGPGILADYLADVIKSLEKKYQVILFHQRGTAKSIPIEFSPTTINLELYLQDIEKVRQDLKLEKWSILGHSWGGMLASAYTASFGNHVEKLILVNSAGLHYSIFSQLFDNVLQRLSGEKYAHAVDLAGKLNTPEAEKYVSAFFKEVTPAYFFNKAIAKTFSNYITDKFLSFSTYGLMMQDVTSKRLDLRKEASKFTNPVLSISGRQDIVGFQSILDIHSGYPNVNFEVLEQAGHYCWLEQPERFHHLIKQFLNN